MKATLRSVVILSTVLSSACTDIVPEPTGVTRRSGTPTRAMLAGSGTWSAKAPMPTPRYRAAGAVLGGKLYAIGGSSSEGFTDVVERYDPTTNSWETRAPLPDERFLPSAASVGGKIYVFGGQDEFGAVSSSVFIYRPGTNSWTTGAAMPAGRMGVAVAALDGKVYAFGGVNASFTEFANADVYDPEANTWNSLAPMPAAASLGRCFAIGGLLYVVTYPYLYIYNPGDNTWSTGASSSVHGEPSAGVVGGLIYVFRTQENSQPARGYTPSTDQWTALATAPAEATVYEAVSGAIGGVIYSSGGFTASTVTGETWAFRPGFAGNHQPTATTDGPWRGVEGGVITFNGSGTDPDNDELTYSWDFGDGDTDEGASVNHAYDDEGEYVVTLTVSDGDKTRAATSRASVRNVRPTVSGIMTTTINAGDSYNFTGTITDPGDETFTATVNWGEGGGTNPYPVTGNSIALNHQYNTPGYYFIVVTINDGDGGVITVNRQVRVKPVT